MTERWRKRLAERPSPPFDAERTWARVEATNGTAPPTYPTEVGPSRGRRAVVALVAFVVFLPIAVAGWFVLREQPVDIGGVGGDDVLFPTWTSDVVPGAIVTGLLVEHDGCLFIRSASGDHLALWERGYSFADDAILAGPRPVARLGDRVSGGGGYYSDRAWAEEITGTAIPDRCVPSGAEPFVLVYDVEAVSKAIVPPEGAPRPFPVGDLQQVGIAVSDEEGLALLDTDGNVLATVPGFEIVGNAGAPGLWLRSGERYYLLDPAADSIVPVSEREARDRMYDESLVQPDLPPPEGTAGGHWRFQLFPDMGTASLAQWSGECEVPHAFWIDGDGTATVITGEETTADAPTSFALGWSPDGEALVQLPEGHCGSTYDGRPGIYRFARPGDGRLVYAIDGLAEMWGVP
jgi:hypothetical protein